MPIIYRQYLVNKKVCFSCPFFSGKYGAPPTRTPKCIDENKNDICDSDEETEETTKDPVSLHDNFTYSESVEKHEFIWNLYLAISNLQTKLERGKKAQAKLIKQTIRRQQQRLSNEVQEQDDNISK